MSSKVERSLRLDDESSEGGMVVSFPTRVDRQTGERLEPWVSKEECARHFGVTTRTVERWLKDGCPKLRTGKRQNSRVRFQLTVVEAWLEDRR